MDEKKKIIRYPVGNGLRNDEEDIKRIKFELAKRNFYLRPVENGFIDNHLSLAIKDFQKRNNLRSDGVMNPGGETERVLMNALDPNRVSNLDQVRREQIINNKNDFKFYVMDGLSYEEGGVIDDLKSFIRLNTHRTPRLDFLEEVSKNSYLIEKKQKNTA